MILILSAATAQASQYDCKLSDAAGKETITYSIDTAHEDNKMVKLGNGASVGCVVFRSKPQLLSCGLGGETFSITAVTEDGSSVLALSTTSGKGTSNLQCNKKP